MFSQVERQLQLEREITEFETWREERRIWQVAQDYFRGLWRRHVVAEFPAHYDPELF